METIFINEQDYISRFESEAFRLRGEGESYVNSLGLNTDRYVHELGNVYWMRDCDLNTNVSYLMRQVRNNYMHGISLLSQQLKAEKERNMLMLFIEASGLKVSFKLFERQLGESQITN